MKTLLCLFEGAFGRRVADALQAQADDVIGYPVDSREGLEAVSAARGIVVARARWLDETGEAVDAAAWSCRIPWTQATLHDRWLLVGPLIVPGGGACHRCLRKRQRTHALLPEREAAIERALRAAGEDGVHGFTPGTVELAASLAAADLATPELTKGLARRFDLHSFEVTNDEVVRIHGCERCGTAPDGERFTRHLIPALGAFLR